MLGTKPHLFLGDLERERFLRLGDLDFDLRLTGDLDLDLFLTGLLERERLLLRLWEGERDFFRGGGEGEREGEE